MATDALGLKHQAISTNSADKMSIALDQFLTKILDSQWTTLQTKLIFQKNSQLFKG